MRRPDFILRLFYAVYYSLCGMQWWMNRPFTGGLIWLKFFSDDLSGWRAGLDYSVLAFSLSFLKEPPYSHFVFVFLVLSALLLLNERFHVGGATGVFIGAQMLAYSAGGRSIGFDMVSHSFIGYWLALLLTPRIKSLREDERYILPWFAASASLFAVYSLAFFSKIRATGWDWFDGVRPGLFLEWGRFRADMEITVRPPATILFDYLSSPSIFSELAILAVLTIEALGLFAVFLGRYVWIYAVMILALTLSIYLSVEIMFRAACVLTLIFAVTGFTSLTHVRRRVLAVAFSISVILGALSWFLPTSRERNNVSVIWPFGPFSMFAWTANNYSLYFLGDQEGTPLPNQTVIDEMRISHSSVNALLINWYGAGGPKVKAARRLCEYMHQRASQALTQKTWTVWVRHVSFDEALGRVGYKQHKMLDCPPKARTD